MNQAEIMRERASTSPTDIAFDLVTSWRDYQLTQHHYQEISLNRLDADSHKTGPVTLSGHLLGMEEEIGEALQLQKAATAKHIETFSRLSKVDRQSIPPERRLECLQILQRWEREQELTTLMPSIDREQER